MVCCGDDVVVFDFMRYMSSKLFVSFLFNIWLIFSWKFMIPAKFFSNIFPPSWFSYLLRNINNMNNYEYNWIKYHSLEISYKYFIQWKILNHFRWNSLFSGYYRICIDKVLISKHELLSNDCHWISNSDNESQPKYNQMQ